MSVSSVKKWLAQFAGTIMWMTIFSSILWAIGYQVLVLWERDAFIRECKEYGETEKCELLYERGGQ